MLRTFIVAALLVSTQCLGQTTRPATLPSPTKVVTYKQIDGVDLKLYIFNPPNLNPNQTYPAVVMFFGGGWKGGTPEQFYLQCAHFASEGIIAISADYRVENRNHTSPKECVMDGKSAMRWLRIHAHELQIDPYHLAAGGGSAGGHVAAATAMIDAYDQSGEDTSISARPDALILFNPVLDNGPTGYGYDRTKDYFQTISPYHNLKPNLPPTLIMLGTKDHLVPTKTMQDFKEQSEKLGNRVELVLYPDQDHGFFNNKNGKNPLYQKTLDDCDRFLASLGYIDSK